MKTTASEVGLRWSEWGRNGRLALKEKFFDTRTQRERFIAKLEQRDTFHEIVAYCDDRS